jgi:hypothetical protein
MIPMKSDSKLLYACKTLQIKYSWKISHVRKHF